MNWLDIIVQGVLLGGLYALFATGLSLVFGIMRLVNLAHGDMIVLAAFLVLLLVSALGLNPLLAAVVAWRVVAYGLPALAGAAVALLAASVAGSEGLNHQAKGSTSGIDITSTQQMTCCAGTSADTRAPAT